MDKSPTKPTSDTQINFIHSYLERIMKDLPCNRPEMHKPYLAGVIDTLADGQVISEEIREQAYQIYVER